MTGTIVSRPRLGEAALQLCLDACNRDILALEQSYIRFRASISSVVMDEPEYAVEISGRTTHFTQCREVIQTPVGERFKEQVAILSIRIALAV